MFRTADALVTHRHFALLSVPLSAETHAIIAAIFVDAHPVVGAFSYIGSHLEQRYTCHSYHSHNLTEQHLNDLQYNRVDYQSEA
ncbi:hypothetical protein EB796_016488 [Bugula neritina]|uniref:Uncharacterized protein n=1 Tax=Bugula neritina TaxID=10212 RepID=A0A7J7JI71_BUGNE|nr:hypothetical protein EB796_016488 [Bugula neritina]